MAKEERRKRPEPRQPEPGRKEIPLQKRGESIEPVDEWPQPQPKPKKPEGGVSKGKS